MPTKTVPFHCKKQPASGAGGVVVTNAPFGSAAGAEMLAAGGNAVDAAVAALLTLTVVEPMMVGITGGGIAHIRLPDGEHVIIDAQASAGAEMRADMFTPVSDTPDRYMEVAGRLNQVGGAAIATPGNLLGWCQMQEKYGRLPFADVIEPAIRAAKRGFTVSPYLSGSIRLHLEDLLQDPAIAAVFTRDGAPLAPGERLVMGDYAQSLKLIRDEGAAALHGGALGAALIARVQSGGADHGALTMQDLLAAEPRSRAPIMGSYRGYEIIGPPPPASSGVHIVQMLNMLEHYDLASMGFGSEDSLRLLAEVIRIGFEDRRAASGDPDFVDVPVARYTSKAYAAECLARLRAAPQPIASAPGESRDTTHVTTADKDGMIVSATHTINGMFGARIMVPGTGIIPNNYMVNFDPRPGKAMSIAPGKRVPTAMAPMIIRKDGVPVWALGLPGGPKIFPSALQAIVNLIDHGMTLQQAVEAPRLWTEGHHIELEPGYAAQAAAFAALGRELRLEKTVGGGMNAISFAPGGMMTGAACWRADGTVMALGGGLAEAGIRFVL